MPQILASRALRILAPLLGIALMVGAVALWHGSEDGRAAPQPAAGADSLPTDLPAPPPPEPDTMALVAPPAPEPKTREERRFMRADRDDDGWIARSEFLIQRRRNFDRLDSNGDGRLSFEEYAAEGLAKFAGADADGDGRLSPAEFATTAAKPKAPPTARSPAPCVCG